MAKEAGIFSGGSTTLCKVLKDMDFKYQVIKNKSYSIRIM